MGTENWNPPINSEYFSDLEMQKLRLAIFISGRGSNFQAIYNSIQNGYLNAEIGLVISNKKNCKGYRIAKDLGINREFISRSKYPSRQKFLQDLKDILLKHNINFIILAGYIRKLPLEIVQEFYPRIINIHPSLLPNYGGKGYYGTKVYEMILQDKQKYSGVTLHIVNEKYDDGPIIMQLKYPIGKSIDTKKLQNLSLQYQWKLLPLALKLISEFPEINP